MPDNESMSLAAAAAARRKLINPSEVVITLDVRTDYPQRLGTGELVYDRSGFLIGQIIDSVVQTD